MAIKMGPKSQLGQNNLQPMSVVPLYFPPNTLVDHASLCLTCRAAQQWALIKKSLALHGEDVKDFEVFKAELMANSVDMAVENKVQYRLAQLK